MWHAVMWGEQGQPGEFIQTCPAGVKHKTLLAVHACRHNTHNHILVKPEVEALKACKPATVGHTTNPSLQLLVILQTLPCNWWTYYKPFHASVGHTTNPSLQLLVILQTLPCNCWTYYKPFPATVGYTTNPSLQLLDILQTLPCNCWTYYKT